METIPESKKENGNVTKVENVVIATEKIDKNGVQYRRIVSVEGCITEIDAKSLPGYVRYMAGQAVYFTRFGIKEEQKDALQMFGHKKNVPNIVVGREIREDLFQNAVRHIGLALNRLQIIKNEQATGVKTKTSPVNVQYVTWEDEWKGEETITVKPVTVA